MQLAIVLGVGRFLGKPQWGSDIREDSFFSCHSVAARFRRGLKVGARILIVDDHEIFRRGLRSLLESRPDWEVCGEATDGQDAVEKATQLQPDVVVLDITMPRLNGLDAARFIRKQAPGAKVVILSQHQAAVMEQVALTAGAAAYVTKSEVSRELLAAIDRLMSAEPIHRLQSNSEPAR